MSTKYEIWRHNSFFGHAAMARHNMQSIKKAETTTHETKEIAEKIESLTHDLIESLRTRSDHLEGKPDA